MTASSHANFSPPLVRSETPIAKMGIIQKKKTTKPHKKANIINTPLIPTLVKI